MPTTIEDRYEVCFDEADVLLVRVVPDGTVSLLAVTNEEWERAVRADQREVPPVDTTRRLFAEAQHSRGAGSGTGSGR